MEFCSFRAWVLGTRDCWQQKRPCTFVCVLSGPDRVYLLAFHITSPSQCLAKLVICRKESISCPWLIYLSCQHLWLLPFPTSALCQASDSELRFHQACWVAPRNGQGWPWAGLLGPRRAGSQREPDLARCLLEKKREMGRASRNSSWDFSCLFLS